MTRLESADEIEGIVGAERHATEHLGRAVSVEQRLYILHSVECVESGIDLRDCEFSLALDDYGIETGPNTPWAREEGEPGVVLAIDDEVGDLLPASVACDLCDGRPVTLYTGGRRYCEDHGPEDEGPEDERGNDA